MERPVVSQLVIDEFTNLVDSQDLKGFKKYGKTIDQAIDKDYNWELMALEETADLQKYLVRRIMELAFVVSKEKEKNLKLENELNGYIVDVESMEGMLHQANIRLEEAKKEISHLKTLSRVSKCLQLEKDNLVLAQENARLKGFMNV